MTAPLTEATQSASETGVSVDLPTIQRFLEVMVKLVKVISTLVDIFDRKATGSATRSTKSEASSSRSVRTENTTDLLPASGNFLWKPESDKDGKLAILLPPSLTGKVNGVAVYSPDGSRTLAEGASAGVGNGDREHFRFSQPGGAFPDGSRVHITLDDGSVRNVVIRDTSARFTR